ncbi:MAG: prohibitin family protein [Huintestinicola sp.]
MAEIINVKTNKTGKIVGGVIAAIVVITIVLNAFTTVQAGHSGVVLTFGKVSEGVLGEGLHFKIPFIQEIVQIDNRVLKSEVDCSSASKDLQTVTSTIALNYRVKNECSATIYRDVGLNYENVIIAPAIQECVKAITAKYTAEELITERAIISDQMKNLLSDKISSYGLELEIFNIISFEFTAEYNAAIEAKQTAQQNALKAEQDLQRIKVEAEQTITQAQAEAEAYRVKSEQITPQMIAMEYIDKWDGKLPEVVSGDGSTMMIDISSLIGEMGSESSNSSADKTPSYTPAPANNTPSAAYDAEDEEALEE